MKLLRNHYEVLGLTRSASQLEIKRKYRSMAREFHPDLVQDKTFGQRTFMQINEAYRTLSDPIERAHYDAMIDSVCQSSPSDRATRQTSGQVESLLREAENAMMNGQVASALGLCRDVLRADSKNAEALSIMGDALAHLKDLRAATIAYRQSLALKPTFVVQEKLNRLLAASAPPVVSKSAMEDCGVVEANARGGWFRRRLHVA